MVENRDERRSLWYEVIAQDTRRRGHSVEQPRTERAQRRGCAPSQVQEQFGESNGDVLIGRPGGRDERHNEDGRSVMLTVEF